MKKRMLGVLLSAVIMNVGVQAMAEELFNKTYEFENGASTMEIEVPDGDYSVNVVTGGETETKANIYINGGERVRAYTQAAGTERDNIQPVIPVDGKIAVEVLGEVPNAVRVGVT